MSHSEDYGEIVYRISYFPKNSLYEIKEITEESLLILINRDNLLNVVQVYDDSVDDYEYAIFISVCPDFSVHDDDVCVSALIRGLHLIKKEMAKVDRNLCCCQENSVIDESNKIDWDNLYEKAEKYKKILKELINMLRVIESLKKTVDNPIFYSIPTWPESSFPYSDPLSPSYPFYTTETTTKWKFKDSTSDND